MEELFVLIISVLVAMAAFCLWPPLGLVALGLAPWFITRNAGK